MRYGDLFTLNPITTVIQLNLADQKEEARELVARFVFTPTLAEQFETLLLPQLTFGGQVEGKGIFVVGNYGTGKSHVMSLVSSIAEHADLLGDVRESAWRDKLEPISGKYRVHRCQIAGSTMGLYNLVAKELTDFAANNGFAFEFTPQNQVVNIKVEFKRFQTTFEQHFPNQGVMLVVDELLHYLESRDNDQGLVLDLSILQTLPRVMARAVLTPFGARFVRFAGVGRVLRGRQFRLYGGLAAKALREP